MEVHMNDVILASLSNETLKETLGTNIICWV